MIRSAAYFEKLEGTRVQCHLCPAECKLDEGKIGICGSRFVRNGDLVTDNYGEVVSVAIDPIEKKPLYHFYPAKSILSTGANGCNLGCEHCQNWSISQEKAPTRFLSPEQLTELAQSRNTLGVAFTYTEPIIWYEYIRDTAPLLKEIGQKVVLVTNGYINPEPLKALMPVMDAANVDLKGMRPQFYKKICKGKLAPVMDTIRTMGEYGIHLEITNLIIPTLNDSDKEIEDLVDFVASISDLIPLHFSAYHPDYKLDLPATPAETMLKARAIAMDKLKFVYVGNIFLEGCSDTVCPGCGRTLIERSGYHTRVEGLVGGKCERCGFETGIVH